MPKLERARPIKDPDPEVKNLTLERLDDAIYAFEGVLRSGSEHDAHQFLSNNTFCFNGMLRLFSSTAVWSKVKFAHEYESDFVFFEIGSYGVEWRFVELESPNMKLTKKSGEPTAEFYHALNQLRDWDEWIRDHIAYAREIFPLLDFPLYYLVAGRRNQLDDLSRKRLRRIQEDFNGNLLLKTYDRFISNAETVRYLVSAEKGGSWPVPMAAFSHRDFVNRRPTHAFEALEADRTRYCTERMRNERRRERSVQTKDWWGD